MSKKGGYRIIDLQNKNITTSTGINIDNLYSYIESNLYKPNLLSGIIIDNVEYNDWYVEVKNVEGNFQFNAYGYTWNVTPENDVAIAPQSSGGGFDTKEGLLFDTSEMNITNNGVNNGSIQHCLASITSSNSVGSGTPNDFTSNAFIDIPIANNPNISEQFDVWKGKFYFSVVKSYDFGSYPIYLKILSRSSGSTPSFNNIFNVYFNGELLTPTQSQQSTTDKSQIIVYELKNIAVRVSDGYNLVGEIKITTK